jgi:RNA polymerase sigma-70 factor (ECF subfamily)
MIKGKGQEGTPDPHRWVDLYGDQLYRYAFTRVKNRMVAEDLVQETFLAALHGGEGFEGRSSEKTWLTAILKNKIVDHFRKMGREQPLNQSLDHEERLDYFFHENGKWKDKPENWDITPERILDQREFWKAFLQCLSELSERLRAAFSLREMEGLRCDEICKILHISSSNCWTTLYRARMSLRRCLQATWFGEKNVSVDV